MKAEQLASNLLVWSKHNMPYPQCLGYAESYLAGTIGDGLIKDYFIANFPSVNVCQIPTCNNQTNVKYCGECYALTPNSTVVGLLKQLGEFLATR